jgi:hypothetical protein
MLFLMCLIKWEENKQHSGGRALAHKSLLFMVSFVMERKPARDKPNCIITMHHHITSWLLMAMYRPKLLL